MSLRFLADSVYLPQPMPSYARKLITQDEKVPASYLLTNRIVRKSFLCGFDEDTKKDYSHRKLWVEDRILALVRKCFFMDLHTYAIMCNHFHVVVTTRPDRCLLASDEEIVQRWWNLFPRKKKGVYPPHPPEDLKKEWLADQKWLEERRRRLSSISWFMGQIAEYIAHRANAEDDCSGRFWEGRFHSELLLDHDAELSANLYVDLNPIRAGMVRRLDDIVTGSIRTRLEQLMQLKDPEDSLPYLSIAIPEFADDRRCLLEYSLQQYVKVLRYLAENDPRLDSTKEVDKIPILNIRTFRFAVGSPAAVNEFAKKRNKTRANRRHPKSQAKSNTKTI